MKDSQFLVSLFIWNKKEKFLKKNEFFFKKTLDIFTEGEYNNNQDKGRETPQTGRYIPVGGKQGGFYKERW